MPIDLLEPKEVEFELPDGSKKTYVLSKFPAVEGREIVCKYPLTGLPKIGDYAENQEIMFKLMSYVSAKGPNDVLTRLATRELVNNHVKSFETLMRIEAAMMEYNCSFFLRGRLSNFFADLAARLPDAISSILTRSLEQLSQPAKPASTNSEQSTH
jgi:hypothetical protein